MTPTGEPFDMWPFTFTVFHSHSRERNATSKKNRFH